MLHDEEYVAARIRIAALKEEHRDLDDAIHRMQEGPYIDNLQLQRMKKRKLQLKDAIRRLEDQLIPDEPA